MNPKELHKAQILEVLQRGHLTLDEAAQYLKLSVRQLRRLRGRYLEQGAAGLIHGNRGRPAANRTSQQTQEKILTWVRQTKAQYNDTHLQEILAERVKLPIGRETLRRLLRSHGFAPKRTRRAAAYFRRRDRKPHRGQMVQWDGSRHRWLGPDQPLVTLMAAIDDADNRLVGALFVPAESAWAYLQLLQQILLRQGAPLSLYQDRHGIHRRSDGHWSLEEQLEGEQTPTQLGQALQELGIEPIFAQTPQAKGRIERFFGLAQDRLLADLTERGITTLEAANHYLHTTWLPRHHRRFQRSAAKPESAYRPVAPEQAHKSLSIRYTRTVAKDNTIGLGDVTIQLPPGPGGRSWAKKRVQARQHLDGTWSVYEQEVCIGQHPATPLRPPEKARIKDRGARLARATRSLEVYLLAPELEAQC